MGFRSTFVSQHADVSWPEWFREKHASAVSISEHNVLASKLERKVYCDWTDLLEDIQKAIDWHAYDPSYGKNSRWPSRCFCILFFHECRGVTRVEIYHDHIDWFEPKDWHKVNGVTHSYCNGCSEPAEETSRP